MQDANPNAGVPANGNDSHPALITLQQAADVMANVLHIETLSDVSDFVVSRFRKAGECFIIVCGNPGNALMFRSSLAEQGSV